MLQYTIACYQSTTWVFPYGRFLTRVFKDVGTNMRRETNFEALGAYDTYDDQWTRQMKFKNTLDSS